MSTHVSVGREYRYVFSTYGGLITPAIPSSQWDGNAQKNQIGFVSLIVRVKTFAFVPLAVLKAPLKNPVLFASGAHGESNED
jgi:hypothetical protein